MISAVLKKRISFKYISHRARKAKPNHMIVGWVEVRNPSPNAKVKPNETLWRIKVK
jgi:hypothetical protein